jgi:hypothetical protein
MKPIKKTDRRTFLSGFTAKAIGLPLFFAVNPLENKKSEILQPKKQVQPITTQMVYSAMLNWVTNPESGWVNYYNVEAVRIKRTTKLPSDNKQDNYVSYMIGTFDHNPQRMYFSTDLKQLFSDRYNGQQAFDRNKPDILNLIFKSDGSIQYTLKSWGDYVRTFTPQCNLVSLFGYDTDGLYWFISLIQRRSVA